MLCVFTVLSGPGDVIVVNVCDGMPAAGSATAWVRACGGRDNAEQMRARLTEDRAAMAMVGREAIGLGFLDSDEREPDANSEQIATALHDLVPAASRLLAPVGIGGHVDHLRTQAAAMSVAGELPVELYADIPYALSAKWEPALARVPAPRTQVVALDAATRAAKARAVDCYATQVGALAGGPGRRFGDDAWRFEVRWSVMAPTG